MSKREYKTTKRKNGTTRYQTVLKGESRTDQSFKQMCDINHMMKMYSKTGMLPQVKVKKPYYADLSDLPDFLEAHEHVQYARELFYQLPSEVRKEMDHQPENLGKFISDPKNKKLMEKYGLIESVKPPKAEAKPEQVVVSKEKTPEVKKSKGES